MKYVMTAAHLHIQGKFIPAGTILPVGDANGFWRVVSGPYEGIKVAGFHCTTFPLYQEVLHLREEVAALTKRNEYLAKKVESQDKAIDKWEKAWEKERGEKRLLQEEINQLVAEKKVPLPREVAEAIEECKNAWNPFGDDIYLHFLNIDGFDDRTTSGRILASYARSKPFEYMSALVNGYTVEQSPAERLKQGIQEIYEQWTHTPSTGDDQADGADLAERITKFVTAELKL